jgi:heme A synthase
MYHFLQHAHSGLRWLVLLFLVLAVVFALIKWLAKRPFWTTHKKIALFALVFTHLQVVLGFILYFISPKVIFDGAAMNDTASRFYLVEHLAGMLISAIIITIGYSRAKRALPEVSAKSIFWYYLIGLVLILASIPWPFREGLGGAWF